MIAEDDGAERHLDLARQPVRVDERLELVLDEAAFVSRLAARHAQAVLERRQGTDAAEERDARGPRGGRQVHPGEPRPAHDEQAAEQSKGDEREVQDEHGIREDAVRHCVATTCRFSSVQRV